ncbi:MAG: PKD domain-containing protein, partial [Bacteroidetes bacterium]|nr:PKD domain-containing protein [Bacteroidota bacterium]
TGGTGATRGTGGTGCTGGTGGTGGSAPTSHYNEPETAGNAPFDASFTDLSTETPTSWSWTFGDGGVSTDQNPDYTYDDEGLYTVTLIATNGAGSDTEIKTDYIDVPEPAMFAQLFSGIFGLFVLTAYRKRDRRIR